MIGIKLSKVRTFRLRKVCGFWKEEKREGKGLNRCYSREQPYIALKKDRKSDKNRR